MEVLTITKWQLFKRRIKGFENIAFLMNLALIIAFTCGIASMGINYAFWLQFCTGLAIFLYSLVSITYVLYAWVFLTKMITDFYQYWFTCWNRCKV